MYPNIYAKYPILEKVGYFEAVKIKQKVSKMEKSKKKNTVTIAEDKPTHNDASTRKSKESKKVPVWKTKGKATPITEMDDDFLRKAYFHSLKKIGEHSSGIMHHERCLNTFMELNGHLSKEAMERDLPWIEEAKAKQQEA